MSNTYGNDINDMKQEVNKDKNINDEVTRKTNTLLKMGKGITHEFTTDEEKGYSKRIPSGAKLASVKKIGGRSLVWNQLISLDYLETWANTYKIENEKLIATTTREYELMGIVFKLNDNFIKKHKYFIKINNFEYNYTGIGKLNSYRILFYDTWTGIGTIINNTTGIIQSPSSTLPRFSIMLTFSEKTNINDTVSISTNILLIDLTKMFGYGNEPTHEEFEAMLNNEYYEYNAGTLINFPTEKIIQTGTNLINIDDYYGKYKQKDGTYFGGLDAIASINIPLSQYKGHTVTFSAFLMCPNDVTNILVSYKDSIVGHKYGNNISSGTSGWSTVIVDNITDDGVVNITYENGPGHLTYFSNIMLLLDNDSSVYSPYKETIYNLPQELLNLNGFGWGLSDTVYNYIDLDTRTYHKLVNIVDLGTLRWTMVTNQKYKLFVHSTIFKDNIYDNALITRYNHDEASRETIDKNLYGNVGGIVISDDSYDNVNDFTESVKGVYLCYKLTDEVVTDISNLIPEGFLEALEVEENGSLTFKSSSLDLNLPVPSTEEYITKLQLSSN